MLTKYGIKLIKIVSFKVFVKIGEIDDYEKALGDYLKIVELDKDQEFAKVSFRHTIMFFLGG